MTVSINLDHGTRVIVGRFYPENPCLGISLETDLPPVKGGSGNPIPIARDTVLLHGTADEIRAFVSALVASIDAPVGETSAEDAEAADIAAGKVAH